MERDIEKEIGRGRRGVRERGGEKAPEGRGTCSLFVRKQTSSLKCTRERMQVEAMEETKKKKLRLLVMGG
jgi:hypothetical protein